MAWAPIQVKMIKLLINIQNSSWGRGLQGICQGFMRGKVYRTRIDDKRAKTPPSLLGIDRKMA